MSTKTNPAPLLADTATDTVYFSNYLPKECPNLYKNLKNKNFGTDKKGNEIIVTLDEDDTRLWQFKLKGLDVNNSK